MAAQKLDLRWQGRGDDARLDGEADDGSWTADGGDMSGRRWRAARPRKRKAEGRGEVAQEA